MSLFEDSRFNYRDTFFIFFQNQHRPTAAEVQAAIENLGSKYDFENLKEDDGKFDSVTVHSPQDYSGMDINQIGGEEVTLQVKDLMNEFKLVTLTGDDRKKLAMMEQCDSRMDVFHFEQIFEGTDEDEILDPGGLLLVLEKLANLCHGISFDPQSQTML
jgi:hypothetical protein